MDPADLERAIDRDLRRLTPLRAPATLAPRVMRAVQARTRAPRYTRGWRAWPIGWRVATAALAVVLCAAAVATVSRLEPAASLGRAADHLVVTAGLTVLASRAEAVLTVALTLWRLLVQPVMPVAVAIAWLMGTVCAVFGLALSRVVLGGTSS